MPEGATTLRDSLAFRDAKDRERDISALGLPTGAPVADSHCHIAMLDDPVRALVGCAWWGVDFACVIYDPSEEYDRTTGTGSYDKLDAWLSDASETLHAEIAAAGADELCGAGFPVSQMRLPDIRMMVGVHPHSAKDWSDEMERVVRETVANNPRAVGIGEIGLDYHYDFSPRDVQREVFAHELAMACELGVPVSLHLREAHDDALDIIRAVGLPEAGCILHCCSLDAAGLRPFLDLGCYVAYGGAITFARSDDARAAARLVPRDRLLTETDTPYMTPTPYRGVECTPAHTVITAARLAREYLGEDAAPEERVAFLTEVHDNAVRLLS